MDVSQLSASLSNAAASAASADRTRLAGSYETFLLLLTSQLRNQNPLEPLDANKFTEQLVQYSTVEQQIKTNENLEAMMASLAASAAMNLVGYVGMTVTARSAVTRLEGGNASWGYTAAADAPDTTVTIYNSAGAVVHSETLGLTEGSGAFTWDGTLADGSNAPAGPYTIAFQARNADGAAIAVDTEITGTVDAVDMAGNQPYLVIGDQMIPLTELLAVGAAAP